MDRAQRPGVTSLRLELGVAIIPRNSLGDTDQKAIRDQLDRLLHSRQFEKSRRRRQFLEYIVNETLAGRADLSAALGCEAGRQASPVAFVV